MASKFSADSLLQLVKHRRSYYALSKQLTISHSRIDQIVKDSLLHVPSSFNSQSTRVAVLFDTEHDKLWDIVTEVLRKKVPEARWEPTGKKMNRFKQAGGTVMFFEDQTVVEKSKEQFPSYADKFGGWATQSDGMLQYTIWLALEAEGLGANLQHYNPIIDEKVAKEWNIPSNWKLNAQLVFGGIMDSPVEKTFMPLEERYRVFGSNL
ncbi:nitroreductase family protein [Fusarium austroafricanum]|uniref:Nitroreductase family protein n=1 Tax=Fusarium austroafricanum TaxID=2364996 RepID=A0A8H4P226_9HYPO|nr:nitroreductase family protein [Fusarium austroafricanum]